VFAVQSPHVVRRVQVLEAQDTEDCLTLVCEAAVPLSLWLTRNRPDPAAGAAATTDFVASLTWGLHCLVSALSFLHADAGVVHGAVNVDTVFVTPGGDWKLCGFDSATTVGGSDDFPPPLWREVRRVRSSPNPPPPAHTTARPPTPHSPLDWRADDGALCDPSARAGGGGLGRAAVVAAHGRGRVRAGRAGPGRGVGATAARG